MKGKLKITPLQKVSAVKDYIEGRKSISQLTRELHVSLSSIQAWIAIFESMGELGLINLSKHTHYSKELKCAAVNDYLSGNYSQLDICKKYKIRSTTQLSNWILKYNSHEEIKSYQSGGNGAMTKGRTTTFEERVEIVKHCIENNREYSKTSEKYKVSYQQVRNWVVKYENNGLDALIDRRGKQKSYDELTELDRLKLENKLLQAENKRLEMQNELLKKLEKIERGW